MLKAYAIAAAFVIALLANAAPAEADFIIHASTAFYDSNWDNPGANDHVTFGGSSFHVVVPLNTTVTAVLESGLFQNDYSYIPDQDFTFSVTQTLSIGSHSVLLTIPGMIRITGPGDTLFTYASDPVSIDLGDQTLLTIVANPITVPLYLGDAPFNLMADFTLSSLVQAEALGAVPAPSSLVMLSTLALSVAAVRGYRWKWRRSTATV
jgi:hypothetical protein